MGHVRADATGGPPGDPDGGVDDPSAADNEYFAARSAPGVVAPGAYGAAWQQMQSMPHFGPTWKSVTWTDVYDLGAGHLASAVASSGGKIYAAWCGGGCGATWKDIPADSIQILPHGALVLSTDLGVFYEAPHSTWWNILGSGLPTNATLQLSEGPDAYLYAATHGRGIWKIKVASGGQNR